VPRFDLLADLRAVLNGDEAVWSETLVGRLVHLRPETYTGWEVDTLNGALRAAGVQPGQIHRKIEGKGVTRHGIRASDLDSAPGLSIAAPLAL
jgi:S-DNA-T family DNA segregation ATPase FtsK/SpoIIIE